MQSKINKKAVISAKKCVACGSCLNACPIGAISMHKGIYAVVSEQKCIGCGKCVGVCPASVISLKENSKVFPKAVGVKKNKREKSCYDYLWIASAIYFTLGFFNILFAWLGMICFITPIVISIINRNKAYCNKYCGRGQLFEVLGGKCGFSLNKESPKFLRSNWFRYGFLTFFMIMFILMLYNTYLVFAGASLKEAITLFWVFKLPWNWTDTSFVSPWIAQFAFGFYGLMLTAMLLGLISMILFKPRTWCVYCPVGTMTQGICILNCHLNNNFKNRKEREDGNKSETDSRTSKSVGQ